MSNRPSNPQPASRSRRRRHRESSRGTNSNPLKNYHTATHTTDPGVVHSHIRTIPAPGLKGGRGENAPPPASKGKTFSADTNPGPGRFVLGGTGNRVRAGCGAGKVTKAGVEEKGAKEKEKEKGSEKGSGKEQVPEEWDEVEVSSDEETTVTAEKVDEKKITVEKIEDLVKKLVEARGTVPDHGKNEETIREKVQEKREEVELETRKNLLLQALSGQTETKPRKPYTGPLKDIAVYNMAGYLLTDNQPTGRVASTNDPGMWHEFMGQPQQPELQVEEIDNRRTATHLCEDSEFLAMKINTPASLLGQQYYPVAPLQSRVTGPHPRNVSGTSARTGLSTIGEALPAVERARIQAAEEAAIQREASEQLFRIAHRVDLVHRLETLHVAKTQPGVGNNVGRETREQMWMHYDRSDPPLPQLSGTGVWGYHTVDDVKHAGLEQVFDLTITRNTDPAPAYIDADIKDEDYARKVREYYETHSFHHHPLPPGTPPHEELDPEILTAVASRLSYLRTASKLTPFDDTPDDPEMARYAPSDGAESPVSAVGYEDEGSSPLMRHTKAYWDAQRRMREVPMSPVNVGLGATVGYGMMSPGTVLSPQMRMSPHAMSPHGGMMSPLAGRYRGAGVQMSPGLMGRCAERQGEEMFGSGFGRRWDH